ncbi:MAG: Fic family protein, partial [Cyanobacteria bacterium P01_A01_bin.114]
MVWIHQRQEWPHFVWDSATLTFKLAEIRYRQGRLLGRMENLGFDLQLEANLNTLTSDVVQSSAIEGKILDSEEVRSSIARKLGLDIGGGVLTSRDVEGIVEMMLDATQNCQQPLTKERLYNWHAALFPTGRSGLYQVAVAAWRPESAGPMQVVSGPIGRQKVHFEAPPASNLDDEMTVFLDWFETDTDFDPVLKAGLAHLWFVTVHPFEDGNGRIARAIADMALARADGTSNRFYSMSAQIESERKTYYTQLERQQRSTVDVTNWLDWFLDCLGRAIESAENALA